MSNTALREGAPKTRQDLQRYLRREQIVNRAVEKLYLLEGGRALEKLLALCDDTLAGAKACREDDLRRLRENPRVTWREKGERPFITLSEQRLHSNLMMRYLDERNALRGLIRTRVNEAINAFAPDGEAELQALLEGMVDAATPQGAHKDEALLKELVPHLNEKDRKDFVAALELRDEQAIKEVLARQPEEVRKRYAA